MNKFVSFLIVLLAIAVATPVLAEDRLSLSGQLRVRGYHADSLKFDDDIKSNASFNQRFRLMGKVAVAEGVSVDFRLDLADKTWGQETGAFNAASLNDSDNRAWVTVDKDMFNIKAGRMGYSIGNAIAVDHQADGAVFTIKGAVPVELGYFKAAERAPFNKDNDVDVYTVAVKHSTDMYSAVVFGGMLRDGGSKAVPGSIKLNVSDKKYWDADENDFDINCKIDKDEKILTCNDIWQTSSAPVAANAKKNIYLVGVQTNMNLDPIKLNVELNYFTGENDKANASGVKQKYRGLQAYLDANMAVTETVTAGGSFFYAQGYKDSKNKTQVTDLTDDGSFLPETYSFMTAQFNNLPGKSLNTTFDPTGKGKGVIGGQLYGQFKVMDDLSLRASAGYWSPEEKDATYKSFTTLTGAARYALAARTNLDSVVSYTIPETRGNADDDAAMLLGFNLNVNF